MKFFLIPALLITLAAPAFAEEKVTLTGVHDCCKKCVDGLNKAVATAPGVTAAVEKTTVTLTAADAPSLQKAVNAIVAAGYTGESDNSSIKVTPGVGPDEKVTSLTVTGAHLCCGKCVKGVDAAVMAVPGVKSHTATKGAESFKIEGEFNGKELMAALAKAGYTGTATK
jgi:copper chaperone CopZ